MAKVIIDAEVCTGKKDCFRVCKVKVFGWEKAKGVTFLTKVKLMIESKGFQAVVKNEHACTACMECVQACPEGAITVDE